MNFSCCSTCATYDLGTMKPPKPFVFWHKQADDAFDMDRRRTRDGDLHCVLFLAFGEPENSLPADPQVIVNTLQAHGLNALHDGNEGTASR